MNWIVSENREQTAIDSHKIHEAEKRMAARYGWSERTGCSISHIAYVMYQFGSGHVRFDKNGFELSSDKSGGKAYTAACYSDFDRDGKHVDSGLTLPQLMEAAAQVLVEALPDRRRPFLTMVKDVMGHDVDGRIELPEPPTPAALVQKALSRTQVSYNF